MNKDLSNARGSARLTGKTPTARQLTHAWQFVLVYCVIFTVATLLTALLQLALGQSIHSNVALLDRAVTVLIGTLSMVLALKTNWRFVVSSAIVPYVLAILAVLVYTWITSLFRDLLPSAYWEVCQSFTVLYVVITILVIINDVRKNRG